MSGDVQPRKRKDKKRKRDSLDRKSEDDLLFSRKTSVKDDEPKEQHQGVHGSKMGTDDVHLHIQGHHETGGHWCAKIFFFSLLAVLFGLIGLIILENRGLADLDTPLSESRFSNYFNGWVDEHRSAHEEHDVVQASIEEHEHDDEPFEEEEDHSEVDEGYEGDEEDNDQHDDGEDDTQEDEDADEDAPEVTGEDSEDDNAKSDEDNEITEEVNDDNDLDDDGVNDQEEENESATEQEDINQEEEHPDDDDDIDDNTDEVPESVYVRTQFAEPISTSAPKESNGDDDDDNDGPLDEEDDDGTFESLESLVVNNDAEELALLKEKARHQEDEAKKGEPEVEDENPSYTSSQIKPRGGGPQVMDDDEFDEELRRANEEMLREFGYQ